MVAIAVVIEHDARVVDAGADTAGAQLCGKRIAIEASRGRDANCVLMEHVRASGGDGRHHDAGYAFECGRQPRRVRAAAGVRCLEAFQLRDRDGGLKIGEAVVVSRDLVLVALPHSLVAEQPQPIRDGVVVGRDDAALAGRDVLRRVQREAPDAVRPDAPAADRGAVRLRGILDDQEVARRGHFEIASIAAGCP